MANADNSEGDRHPPRKFFLADTFSKVKALWTRLHKHHVLWDVLLAVLIAAYFAYYFTDAKPYTMYVFLGYDIPNTEDGTKTRTFIQSLKLSVDGTPVEVKILPLGAATQSASQSADDAISAAAGVIQDAIMVVGILDSGPTKASLPTYFQARPQIPFIAAVQTDDNLLGNCTGQSNNPSCFDGGQTVPLLQLSPTNQDQARWAIEFAAEQKMKKFLIIYDETSANIDYVTNLRGAYKSTIENLHPTFQKDESPISTASAKLDAFQPDCVLYAGDSGNVQRVLVAVTALRPERRPAVVLLSDTAIPKGEDAETTLSIPKGTKGTIGSLNLADQSDARNYMNKVNAYAEDSLAISGDLLRVLDRDGFDWRFRVKKMLLNHTTAADIRRNLLRVMQSEISFQDSYPSYVGTSFAQPVEGLRMVYTFDCRSSYCKRYGGIFHVWQWKEGKMEDVDHWHP